MNYVKKLKYLSIVCTVLVISGMASAEMYKAMTTDRVLAYVRRYKPTVNIFPKDISADKGEPLYSGDTLRTNQNGYAAVQFMDKSIAKVKPMSELIVNGEVRNDKSASTRIALETGELFLEVTQRSRNDFEVATSSSVASVKGTKFGARSDSYYWVEEGVVELLATQSGQTVELTQNMYGQVQEDNTIETGELSDEEVEELQNEYEELDQQEPKRLRLRFRDQNGQIREIEIEYYENSENN